MQQEHKSFSKDVYSVDGKVSTILALAVWVCLSLSTSSESTAHTESAKRCRHCIDTQLRARPAMDLAQTAIEEMKGDTNVVERLERESFRSDRASRLIRKKLDKSKRNQKKQRTVPVAILPSWSSNFFADSSSFPSLSATITSRRRLLRVKDGIQQAFYVGELVSGFEEVAALVVVCATEKSDSQRIADTCLKEDGTKFVVSDAVVHLFECDIDVEICGETYKHVCIQKLHLQDGQTLFWVVGRKDVPRSCPWELGLDSYCYKKFQAEAAKLLAVRITE